MRVELCEFKRCCLCLPLRYGVLLIGYLKLMISSAMLLAVIWQIVIDYRRIYADSRNHLTTTFTIGGTICGFLLADIAFVIVYLIGSHKKDAKLLKVFNYNAIGMLVFGVLAFFFFVGYHMIMMKDIQSIIFVAMMCREAIAFLIVTFCFHVYMIFLNRSEILKLEANCNFRFENIANEAQCTMEVGEIASVEKRKSGDLNEAIIENEENQQMRKKTNGSYAGLSN